MAKKETLLEMERRLNEREAALNAKEAILSASTTQTPLQVLKSVYKPLVNLTKIHVAVLESEKNRIGSTSKPKIGFYSAKGLSILKKQAPNLGLDLEVIYQPKTTTS